MHHRSFLWWQKKRQRGKGQWGHNSVRHGGVGGAVSIERFDGTYCCYSWYVYRNDQARATPQAIMPVLRRKNERDNRQVYYTHDIFGVYTDALYHPYGTVGTTILKQHSAGDAVRCVWLVACVCVQRLVYWTRTVICQPTTLRDRRFLRQAGRRAVVLRRDTHTAAMARERNRATPSSNAYTSPYHACELITILCITTSLVVEEHCDDRCTVDYLYLYICRILWSPTPTGPIFNRQASKICGHH